MCDLVLCFGKPPSYRCKPLQFCWRCAMMAGGLLPAAAAGLFQALLAAGLVAARQLAQGTGRWQSSIHDCCLHFASPATPTPAGAGSPELRGAVRTSQCHQKRASSRKRPAICSPRGPFTRTWRAFTSRDRPSGISTVRVECRSFILTAPALPAETERTSLSAPHQ